MGLVRLCLGSTMTSSDLPPDLHSNHIEILYFIDLLRIGPVPAYTLFVYLALSAAVAKYFNIACCFRFPRYYLLRCVDSTCLTASPRTCSATTRLSLADTGWTHISSIRASARQHYHIETSCHLRHHHVEQCRNRS